MPNVQPEVYSNTDEDTHQADYNDGQGTSAWPCTTFTSKMIFTRPPKDTTQDVSHKRHYTQQQQVWKRNRRCDFFSALTITLGQRVGRHDKHTTPKTPNSIARPKSPETLRIVYEEEYRPGKPGLAT